MITLEEKYGTREAQAMRRFALEHITGHDRSWLLTHEHKLTHEQQKQYDEAVLRMINDEPVQYIFNSADFMGLELYVDNRVLIPRPETAELVEWILDDFSSLRGCRQCVVSDGSKRLDVIDACTGSGCIALALKATNQAWDVHAFDISSGALEVAQKNSKKLELPITLQVQDLKTWADNDSQNRYDIIVANPPYIMPSEADDMSYNVLNYEPHDALFVSDNDKLWPYRALANAAKRFLTDGGRLYAEINPQLAEETLKLFSDAGFTTQIRCDLEGKQRMIRVGRDTTCHNPQR